MSALVTAIIPVHNSIRTIERTLVSTYNQGVELDVILIDDNSQDGSSNFIKSLISQYKGNFKLITSSTNLGASGARNLGIAQTETPYIAFLDSDDIWLPYKLATQIKLMEADSSVILATTDSLKITPAGTIRSRSHNAHRPVSGPTAWKELLEQNFIPTPTVLTKTEAVKSLNGFKTDLAIGEDLDLWISLAKMGSVAYTSEVFVHFFDYSGSLMKRSDINQFTKIMEMINQHLDDNRLTDLEKNQILAKRYYEIGKGIGRLDKEKMNEYFLLAQQHGFKRSNIIKNRIRRKFKNALKTHFF